MYTDIKYRDKTQTPPFLRLLSKSRYPTLRHLFFFLNEKKMNIFCLMNIALFIKVIYWIQTLIKKILYTVFLTKLLFLTSEVNFLLFSFIETKSLNID